LVEAKPPLFRLAGLVAALGRRVVQFDGHGLAAVGFTSAAFFPKGFARQAVVYPDSCGRRKSDCEIEVYGFVLGT
jgi:hypothetical protein